MLQPALVHRLVRIKRPDLGHNRFSATNRSSLSTRTFTAVGIHFKTTTARAPPLNHLSIGAHEMNSSYALVCVIHALFGADPG